jgi:hypothetical protein
MTGAIGPMFHSFAYQFYTQLRGDLKTRGYIPIKLKVSFYNIMGDRKLC